MTQSEHYQGLLDSLARAQAHAETLIAEMARHTQAHASTQDTVLLLTAFVLACFIGYYVIWNVTPALHSPLMGVTNAISSVIIIGALIAAGPSGFSFSKVAGFFAVVLASVNIFGGFIVTHRMLAMFKRKRAS